MNGSTVFESDQHRSHTRSIHLTDVRSRNEYESDRQATSTPTTSKTILENNVNKSQSPNIHNSEKFSPEQMIAIANAFKQIQNSGDTSQSSLPQPNQ
uniref:Uncharacterized protein n=1 Tax=Caenorhabditis japonica TaxID=281687 RepID=A0A8R1ISD3_CAEJA